MENRDNSTLNENKFGGVLTLFEDIVLTRISFPIKTKRDLG